jgi:hypothetical protein
MAAASRGGAGAGSDASNDNSLYMFGLHGSSTNDAVMNPFQA